MRLAARLVWLVASLLLVGTAPALAHGDVAKLSPPDGANLDGPPRRVAVTLTETPVPESTMRVEDGCGRKVSKDVAVEGDSIVAEIEDAQPGRWAVRWSAISAVDGHPTEGSWSFTVGGDKHCSRSDPTDDESPAPTDDETTSSADESPEPHADHTPASAAGDDDAGFPIVPVGIGATAIIALAIVARRFGSR